MKTNRFLLAASIVLAMVFTVSCELTDGIKDDLSDDGGSENSTATIFCQTANGCAKVTPDACLAFEGLLVSSCENSLSSSSSSVITGISSTSNGLFAPPRSSSGNSGNSSSSSEQYDVELSSSSEDSLSSSSSSEASFNLEIGEE